MQHRLREEDIVSVVQLVIESLIEQVELGVLRVGRYCIIIAVISWCGLGAIEAEDD